MRTSHLLIPAVLAATLILTGCGGITAGSQMPTSSPATTAQGSSGTIELGHGAGTATSPSTPAATTPVKGETTSTASADRDAAIKALAAAGDNWYASLGPDLKDKIYTKDSSAKLVPVGTVIKAKPETWEPTNPNEAEIVATFSYPSGRSSDYDVTMVKINGKWLINFTIMHF